MMTNKFDTSGSVLYEGQTFQLVETPVFADWFGSMRDRRASAAINNRLLRAANGNFGDYRSVQGGVFEMRVDIGPGYRVYYFRRENALVFLLCGGDKQTQKADIAEAKRLKVEIERKDGTSSL
jgi:putative addiction module killer protein